LRKRRRKRLRKRLRSGIVGMEVPRRNGVSGSGKVKNEGELMNAKSALVVAVAATTLFSLSAHSEDSGASSSKPASDQLEEVIVTAQKRSESLSKTPLAVSALSQEQLQDSGVVSLENLTSAVPNVELRTVGYANSIAVTIRGITNTDFNQSGDPAVATYVDGVYIARTQGLEGALYDLERIEVLRGPQGTLYGRNATGGNINVVTADPKPDFGAAAGVSYGNYNDVQTRGMVNIPLSSTLAIRGAFVTHRNNGYYDTEGTTAQNYGMADDFGGRVTALWTPIESFRWRLSVDDFISHGTPVPDFATAPNGTPEDGLPIFKRPMSSYPEPSKYIDNFMARSRMDWQMGNDLSLAYIAGYQHLTWNTQEAQTDGIFDSNRGDTSYTYSHEINLNYDSDKIRNILGANYFAMPRFANADAYHLYIFGITYANQDRVRNHSVGIFDQATYSVLDNLRLIGGIRYSSESKYERGELTAICPISQYPNLPFSVLHAQDILPGCTFIPLPPINNQKATFKNVTWRAGVEYDLSKDTMAYVTVTTGFKSGGMNEGAAAVPTFSPEEVTNYELGVKNRLFNDQVSLNAAFFYENYTNLQVTQLMGTGSNLSQITANAAAASIYGTELEAQWRITPNDQLGMFFNYLKATYRTYNNAVDAQTNIVYPSLKGNTLPFAPKVSAKIQYQHDFTLPNGGIVSPMASGYFQTKTYLRGFDLPIDQVDGYTKSALSVRYQDPTGRWRTEAYINNLENRTIRTSGYTVVGNYFSDYDLPRIFGVRASYSY
jgi:iron complex outermembrane receptor protein